jgi:hypothetical protein
VADQSGGLVDDEQAGVLVDDVEHGTEFKAKG